MYAQILKGLWKSRFWMFFSHLFFMLLLYNTIVVDLEKKSSVWWPEGCVFDKIYAWQDEIKVKNRTYFILVEYAGYLGDVEPCLWNRCRGRSGQISRVKAALWIPCKESKGIRVVVYTAVLWDSESSEHYPTKEILYFF